MHEHLLEQARQLAEADPGRPRQANVRRAVSSAYYALFHFLVDQACRTALGTQPAEASLRRILGRAFDHGTMKAACKSFSGGNLPANIARSLPATFRVPPKVRKIASLFVTLQERRHSADYDLTQDVSKSDALTLIAETEQAISDFGSVGANVPKKFFVTCLLAWKGLENRK